ETEKQGFKRGAADDGGYVIQASCERRTLQSFIDDELRTEFAKFPPFVLTILKIVCADPNRTIQVDTNGNVHLLRGYHADNELAEPLFQKVSPNDLLNAISFLYNRGGFDKPAGNRNTPSGFYIPPPQSFLIDTFRRERLDKVSPSASSHNF
ncbi:MAG: hypothetical protein IJ387_01320, partial [Thermoguttaceae bacterium]|nr:hypothetical protein [Thermoguttaceae bacterium]